MNRYLEESEPKQAKRLLLDAIILIFLYLFCVSIPAFATYTQENITGAMRLIYVLPCLAFIVLEGFTIIKGDIRRILLCLPMLVICFGNIAGLLVSGGSVAHPGDQLLWMIMTTMATAICEELVYRAALIPALKGYPTIRRLAIVIAAAIFGLSHLLGMLAGASILGSLMQAGYTFLLGLALGVVYEFGGILPAILIHFLFNFFQNDLYIFSGGGNWDGNFILFNLIFGILGGIYAVFLLFISIKSKQK